MPATQSFTGRQGQATIAGNIVPITKWTAKITRAYADSTDSATYDPGTGQTWETQAPGTVVADGTMEGNFDLATTSADIIQLFKSDGPFTVLLALTRAQNFMSGSATFQDCEVTISIPGATMCTWSCNWKSYGIPILY
jgi:hypothetical protein